jgi:hypothetical protein
VESAAAGAFGRGYPERLDHGRLGRRAGGIGAVHRSPGREQLLRPAHPPKGAPANGIGIQPWAGGELRFDRFTDMQDLLLLDPIHEVDEEVGWPKPSR